MIVFLYVGVNSLGSSQFVKNESNVTLINIMST